jgi:hypothetical protein
MESPASVILGGFIRGAKRYSAVEPSYPFTIDSTQHYSPPGVLALQSYYLSKEVIVDSTSAYVPTVWFEDVSGEGSWIWGKTSAGNVFGLYLYRLPGGNWFGGNADKQYIEARIFLQPICNNGSL